MHRPGSTRAASGPTVTARHARARALECSRSATRSHSVSASAARHGRLSSRRGYRAHGRAGEVTNAGTISYGVFQEFDLLRSRGLVTRPEVVVHALYWNDHMNAGAPPPGAPSVVDDNGYFVWDQLSTPRPAFSDYRRSLRRRRRSPFRLKQPSAHCCAAGTARQGTRKAYQQLSGAGLTEAEWQPVVQFYRDLKRLAAEHDFVPFVVIMPVSDLMTSGASSSHPYPIAARRMLEEVGIPYVDAFALWPECKARKLFLPEGADAHLNSDGYSVIAEALADALLAQPATSARISLQ